MNTGTSPDLIEVVCPLCSSEQSSHLFTTKDYLFAISGHQFGIRKCTGCGCGFLSPRPTQADIGRYYPEAFYWAWEGAEGKLPWEEIIRRREKQLSAKKVWLDGVTSGKLLDVGAQKGEFLWFMQRAGWDVQGVEMDSKVPNPGGMPIHYGDFLAMDFGDEKFDAITLWAVLEHVYNPAMFIEKASALLKPGGRLVVLVTNLHSIQARYYQADDYPRHLTLFTRNSIALLCRRHHFLLDKVVTDQKIFGGTLNGGLLYGVKRLFGYPQSEALREWKQLEDPDLFWCKWRGKPSTVVRIVSKLDRLISYPVERLLDRLGFGFIITFSATRSPVESRNV
jgi:SAM-dependent methyltransferase